ncbi:MAG: phosphoribosyltransferase family protein [Planctomycetota bacterium]
MQADIDRTLLSAKEIAIRLDGLARQIATDLEASTGLSDPDHPTNTLTLVPVMTGSIIFVADLVRRLDLRMKIFPMSVTSYPGTATASQGARIEQGLDRVPNDLTGHHVLLVDDILDSGSTLRTVSAELKRRNPKTLHTCVLLRKPRPEALALDVDYVAFDIPDEFVVGYGLDFDDQYRNLPEIVTLKPEVTRA